MIATATFTNIMKKTGWHWVGDYALPMSLILGMASAIPITGWLS